MTCRDCLLNKNCPCGYSCGNAACLTVRKQYADAMTTESDALYQRAVEDMQYCKMYELTYNSENGSM